MPARARLKIVGHRSHLHVYCRHFLGTDCLADPKAANWLRLPHLSFEPVHVFVNCESDCQRRDERYQWNACAWRSWVGYRKEREISSLLYCPVNPCALIAGGQDCAQICPGRRFGRRLWFFDDACGGHCLWRSSPNSLVQRFFVQRPRVDSEGTLTNTHGQKL